MGGGGSGRMVAHQGRQHLSEKVTELRLFWCATESRNYMNTSFVVIIVVFVLYLFILSFFFLRIPFFPNPVFILEDR